MPKCYTSPFLIDQQKTLTAGFLSKSKYFTPNKKTTGWTGWTSNRTPDLDISITVIMSSNNERVILNYFDFNGDPVNQIIYLESNLSNLGKGLIWFFVCPFTGATCRNLVFASNRFRHRSDVFNAMYSKQAESRYWRKLFKLHPNIPDSQKILDEPKKKYYKTFYNGNITKRYKKHLLTLQQWNNNSEQYRALLFSPFHR